MRWLMHGCAVIDANIMIYRISHVSGTLIGEKVSGVLDDIHVVRVLIGSGSQTSFRLFRDPYSTASTDCIRSSSLPNCALGQVKPSFNEYSPNSIKFIYR